jgi:uncharacterized protein (DUF305 family)
VSRRSAAVLLVFSLAAAIPAACRTASTGPRVVQPGAPGEPSRTVTATPDAAPAVTPADVAFMQGMIGHHAQAIEMTDLLDTRTSSAGMRRLALRIAVSQADEINMMRGWLEKRGLAVPDAHAHHMGGPLMPGMLTPEEMARLAAASDTAFDRLFLELMIKHHQGALTMVRELFAQPGAAQQSDIFAFASDVEADQSIEIERMRRMLAAGRYTHEA